MGFGPQDAPGPRIPAGTPGKDYLRNFGGVASVLAAANVPIMKSTVGLGTGGGASVQIGISNGSFGNIEILTGSNPSVNGNVDITFQSAPGAALKITPGPEFGTVTLAPSGNDVVIAWTTDTFLPNHRYKIPYTVGSLT